LIFEYFFENHTKFEFPQMIQYGASALHAG
jgi:hypothetical protein